MQMYVGQAGLKAYCLWGTVEEGSTVGVVKGLPGVQLGPNKK